MNNFSFGSTTISHSFCNKTAIPQFNFEKIAENQDRREAQKRKSFWNWSLEMGGTIESGRI